MIKYLLFSLLIIISSKPIISFADHEIRESQKCTNMFPIFEVKHNIPMYTLHSIALRESGKYHQKYKFKVVWPWTVNVEGQGHFFKTKAEAILFVKKQILAGKENIDVGCMQINLKHHLDAFSSLDHAFEPSNNVAYGVEFFMEKYKQTGSWHKAIANYHSATYELGSRYRQEVIKIANNMDNYHNILNSYLKNDIDGVNYDNKLSSKPPIINPESKIREKIIGKNRTRFAENRMRSNIMVPIY